MRVRVLAVAVAVAACAAPSAEAAGWKQVTASDGASTDQVGLLRTPDGVLHVAWRDRTGPNTEDLLHTVISAGGRVGATTPIQTGWTGFSNPALVSDPSGIRAFWGGIRTTNPGETNQELNTAQSPDGGGSWALQIGSVVQTGGQAYAYPIAATTRPDGTTLQAWAGTLGTWVHSGLTPATPNHDYQAPIGQYGYDPNLATDASGRTVMAWYSSAAGRLGVLAQDVAGDGSPVGSAVTMPQTSNMPSGMIARTPLAARAGGGFYVAYPTGYPAQTRVRVWRVGAGNAPEVARTSGQGNQPVTLAAAADGRIWVAWAANRNGVPRILARRSNPGATRFGAAVAAGRAGASVAAYRLDSSAAGGALDVLAAFNIGTTSNVATHHRRLLPGLTLSARPGKLRRGARQDVRFTVSDAGDPVKGARVRAGGKSGVTNAAGRVTLELAGRAATAKASRVGYTGARKRLGVRR